MPPQGAVSFVALATGDYTLPMLAATYDEFEHLLRQARALGEPAEAHGTLTGALCSSRDYGLIEWLRANAGAATSRV